MEDFLRNKGLSLKLTQEELDLIKKEAEELNKNRTNTIIQGIQNFEILRILREIQQQVNSLREAFFREKEKYSFSYKILSKEEQEEAKIEILRLVLNKKMVELQEFIKNSFYKKDSYHQGNIEEVLHDLRSNGFLEIDYINHFITIDRQVEQIIIGLYSYPQLTKKGLQFLEKNNK